jgi:hypothetical protein
MTLTERKEAIKDYVKRNRDFAFFTAGAVCTVVAEVMLLKHLNTKELTVQGDVIVNEETLELK